MDSEKVIETDLLVIGGGIAGLMAGINAKTQNSNIDVTIVDKGYSSRSGASNIIGGHIEVYDPESGEFDECMAYNIKAGEYLVDKDWITILRNETFARYKDLESWGVDFVKDEKTGKSQVEVQQKGEKGARVPIRAFLVHSRSLLPPTRKKAVQSGVKILDRIMVTDLLKEDGHIVGAVGFHTREGTFYTFKAKAVILVTGSCYYQAATLPQGGCTGDGHAMAYRAGATMCSMEITGRRAPNAATCDVTALPAPFLLAASGGIVNARGEPEEQFCARYSPEYMGNVVSHWLMSWAFEVHAGRGPILYDYSKLKPEYGKLWEEKYMGEGGLHTTPGYISPLLHERAGIKLEGIQETKLTMLHPAGGVLVTGYGGETTLPGLYAAGDAGYNNRIRFCMTSQGEPLSAAICTGWRAGEAAAKYALEAKEPVGDDEQVARLKEIAFRPLQRKGGFSPDYVLERLQNMIIPYDILTVRHGKRLQAALIMVEFFRDHFVPKLRARDPHYLRNAHEVKNMVLHAAMVLRSSLFRTESRGEVYREDYPRRDDKNWLAWTVLKEENGEMKLDKLPMPAEWRPDPSLSYRDKYDHWRFPVDVDPEEGNC